MERRIPKSSKGESTWRDIYESARKSFLNTGYHKTSVVKISKAAKVSSATFYQYFSSKEEIFDIILQSFQTEIQNLFNDSYKREDSMEENLRRMVEGFCEITYKFKSEFKAYREAEFTNVVETAKFHGIFLNFISKTIGKKAKKEDLVHFWFIIGPLLYLSIYWVLWNDKKVPDSDIEGLIDFYLNGISPEKYEFVFSDLSLNDNDKSNEIKLDESERTKKKILRAAEILFGKKGYNNTTIHELCSECGCSVGAFYLYFDSKKEVLESLERESSHSLRLFLKKYAIKFRDRRDFEIVSFIAFLKFFSKHEYVYSIIREAEFVDKQIAMEYYDSLQKPYEKGLIEAIKENQIRKMDVSLLSKILMGIGHLLGHSLIILGNVSEKEFFDYIKPLSELILNGLKIKSWEELK